IVSDVTTCRRHIQFKHSGLYHTWCDKNGFESKLPDDVKKRKEAIALANAKQARIDGHLREPAPTERVIPYTDALYREASCEWLIETNQPIQAVDHPKFRLMIDIASRATNGVIVPNRNATRREIMDMFKRQMTKLKERLNVR
ncbi:hypothetical protein BV22DRAFT_1012537, partial [Leucogyrophana mollusca]